MAWTIAPESPLTAVPLRHIVVQSQRFEVQIEKDPFGGWQFGNVSFKKVMARIMSGKAGS